MEEMPVNYKIRIPTIDKLLTEHNKLHVSIVSVNNTKEDKKKLRELDETLATKIDDVNVIVCEVLEYLQARGLDTSEYI
jgi:hypothetical protein